MVTLSGAADSKLVQIEQFRDEDSAAYFTRFRLEVLQKLLRNESVLITEGWALDSLIFLKVASEIIKSSEMACELDGSFKIDNFTPFVMERRRFKDVSYPEMYRNYLLRKDVRWSGLGGSEFNHSLQKDAGKILEVKRFDDRRHDSGKLLGDAIREALKQGSIGSDNGIRDEVCEALETVASYFLKTEKRSMFNAIPDENVFETNIANLFYLAENHKDSSLLDSDSHRSLSKYFKKLKKVDLSSSSPIMKHCEEKLPPHLQEIVFSWINTSYLAVSANGFDKNFNKALDISTVPCWGEGTQSKFFAEHIIGKHQIFPLITRGTTGKHNFISNARHEAYSQIKRLAGRNLDPLTEVFDWKALWSRAILLASKPKWQNLIETLKDQEVYESPKRADTYKEMNRLLKEHDINVQYDFKPNIVFDEAESRFADGPAGYMDLYMLRESIERAAVISSIAKVGTGIANLTALVLPEWDAPVSEMIAGTALSHGVDYILNKKLDKYNKSISVVLTDR